MSWGVSGFSCLGSSKRWVYRWIHNVVPRGAAAKVPFSRGPTLKSLCSVVVSLKIRKKHLYKFLEIGLKTMNMVLLQPAETADRGVFFLK